MTEKDFFTANWNAPENIKTLLTYRTGGVSSGAYSSLNFGLHVGDNPNDVLKNRKMLQDFIPVNAVYLNQIHSNKVIYAPQFENETPDADASWDDTGRVACVIMTADCLPVLLCNNEGNKVAAIHCGWKSLASNIIANTVVAMKTQPENIYAYLGAAIGENSFEVGVDVYNAFVSQNQQNQSAFIKTTNDKFFANIYKLAQIALNSLGVYQIYGGGHCTVKESDKFFSYRREKITGRMVSAIWIE